MIIREVTDHLDRNLQYTYPPKRIISIVPAITDTLYALNLHDNIVGRTRYCIFPKEQVQKAEIVGGTKRVLKEKIESLKPDIIFAEKEENTKEIVEQLETDFPVYVGEVQSVQDVYKLIGDLGDITGKQEKAKDLIETIQQRFNALPSAEGKRVAYVIWKNPYMVVGQNTYINSLLERLGFVNGFAKYEGRYPVVAKEDLKEAKLDYLFLATEPFPFQEEHIPAFTSFLPNTEVRIIDGEMFWYGPRMIEAADYFQKFLLQLVK